jgi:hypothetical protein
VTDGLLQAADVRAVIVGIGEYEAGPGWRLAGPVEDALRFARLLVTGGVPPGNLTLLLAPLPDPGAVPVGVEVRGADRASVRRVFRRELPACSESVLYVIWGGHGFVDPARHRRLYYADATAADAIDLDLDSLLDNFASTLVPALQRQVWIIDVCQTFGPGEPQMVDGHETFPVGEPAEGRRQDVLFAAGRGQSAVTLRGQRSGLFSREVLRLLQGVDPAGSLDRIWLLRQLLDPAVLVRQLRERFAKLQADGLTGQEPTYLWYRNILGEEERVEATRPVAGPTLSPGTRRLAVLRALVDPLTEVPEFLHPNHREQILALLPHHIIQVIRRFPDPRADAISVVSTCLRYPAGLPALVEAVRFYAGDIDAVRRLEAAAATL